MRADQEQLSAAVPAAGKPVEQPVIQGMGPSAPGGRAAFTLVEVVISLGVIAFALVAIIGILPIGLGVQKDNRQDTVVCQDAGVLLEAIRNGQQGLDDLTNYVMAITNYSFIYQLADATNPPSLKGSNIFGYTYLGSWNGGSPQAQYPLRLTNGAHIIGLLGTPRKVAYNLNGDDYYFSNYVVAYVRSLSGEASEKAPQTNQDVKELAFSYRLTSEVVPSEEYFYPWTNVSGLGTNIARSNQIVAFRNFEGYTATNLHDVRLTFLWPLMPNGSVSPKHRRRQIFHTLVAGQVLVTNEFYAPTNYDDTRYANLYFLDTHSYSCAAPK